MSGAAVAGAEDRDAIIGALARSIEAHLAANPLAAPFLTGWPTATITRPTEPGSLPVCRWLPELAGLAAPATLDLVRQFVAAAPLLDWRQTYVAADFGEDFLASYGWTELIGLRGPIASEKLACGFLLLGPNIVYPAHAHEAEELYLPLAGEALWMRDDQGWTPRHAGEAILHPAWMAHATRTRADPLLALYVWRGGDLAAKSRILGQTPGDRAR